MTRIEPPNPAPTGLLSPPLPPPRLPRPTRSPVAVLPPARAVGRLAAFLGRLRDAAEALVGPGGGRRIHDFADLVERARQPEPVEGALVAVAGEISGACRVELVLDREGGGVDGPDPRRLALWPEASGGMTADEVEALGYPLCLGLWCGDRYRMTLRLYRGSGGRGRWPRRVVRRLATLCALAAAAERGLHAGRRARFEPADEAAAPASVRDATFLNAILPYALSQARRHREPLAVVCVEIDRLCALRRSHGPEAADRAVLGIAGAAARALRGSDVVARLDDDRVVVVLPNTGPDDALTVAGVVRAAVSAVGPPAPGAAALTASFGVSGFPDDGRDMVTLLAAADEAVSRARALGPGRVAAATPPEGRGVGETREGAASENG